MLYLVRSRFFDSGKATATIIKVIESESEVPEHKTSALCDTYYDTFESRAEAEIFVKDTRAL